MSSSLRLCLCFMAAVNQDELGRDVLPDWSQPGEFGRITVHLLSLSSDEIRSVEMRSDEIRLDERYEHSL